MKAVEELRRQWAPMDPAAGEPGSDEGQRATTLAAILETGAPPPPPPRRWAGRNVPPGYDTSGRSSTGRAAAGRVPLNGLSRRWILAGAGAAAVSVAVAVVVVADRGPDFPPQSGLPPAPQGGYRMTPLMLNYAAPGGEKDARGRLERIADAAAAQPAPPPSDLPEHHKIKSWDLFTRVGDEVTSTIVVTESESWRAANDSGAIVHKRGGKTETMELQPGQIGMWHDRPPTGTDQAAAWLKMGHPAENGPAEVMVAITDLARERVLTPAERAAVLRVLARVPGLMANGEVEDRAGRIGQAFSLNSRYTGLMTRYTLIVDPATGEFLGFEQMLTENAGKLNVKIPSVIGYESYLVADHAARRA